jgi:tetratricopeptide (TPR) repeat protein
MPLPVIAGRFAIEREAGAGGMATVYRARDLASGAVVAIKCLASAAPPDVERFAQEASILSDLIHPAIVRYVSHGLTAAWDDSGGAEGGRQRPYLAMEWLEGEDLGARLALGALPPAEVVFAMRRVADALSAAHARGVIHRDIKPENLFLPDGQLDRIKLLDFGIARLAGDSQRLTATGLLIGTPGYLAPEVIGGLREVNPPSDIFALGCVMFHCLTGRAPFEADSVAATLAKVLMAEVPRVDARLPEVPRALADLVASMMARAPADRPSGAVAVVRALDEIAVGLPRPASATERARAHSPRLTVGEQRIVSLVAARLARPAEPDAAAQRALRGAGAERFELTDGTLIFGLPQARKATDQAQGAARVALTLLAQHPDAAIALCTGPGQLSLGAPTGGVVDAVVDLLARTPAGTIRVDGVSAGLLEGRFELQRAPGGDSLRAPCAAFQARRHLLGRSGAFVGRARELALLTSTFLSAASESVACAVLMIAPAGSGKSRLRQEFLDWVAARAEPVEVLFAAGDSVGTGSPFSLLGQALRRAAAIADDDPPDERQRKLALRVSRHLDPADAPRVVVFLGELAGVPFPDAQDPILRSARADPQIMGDRLRRAFEDWLSAECRARPMLLVLDDLQWSDAGTVSFIDAALRHARDVPLMVIASARPEVEKSFPNLWAERDVQVLRLGPLSRKAAEALVRDALGAEIPAALVARLIDRADGNPFYLEELIRATHDGRQEGLPDSVLGMVQARLDAEPIEARRVLRAASVFGERFSAAGVCALLGGAEQLEDIAGWLRHLSTRELVGPAERGGGEAAGPGAAPIVNVTFTHALIREAAYAMLTPQDRTLGHRLAGHWMADSPFPDPMLVAEHLRRGDQPERASGWYEQAAALALGANDLEAAIDRAELGLAAVAATAQAGGDPGQAPGRLRVIKAEAHLWRGEPAVAGQAAAEAARDLSPGSAAWLRAAAHAIIAAGRQGRLDQMDGWVAQVTGVMPDAGARNALTISLAWASIFLVFGGRYEAADELLQLVADLAGEGDGAEAAPQVAALLHQARAARASTRGDLGACLVSMEAALAAFERAGDERNACTARANLGFVYTELGDTARAEVELRNALATAERMSLTDVHANVLQNLGRVVGLAGDLAEAERMERAALAQLERRGEPRVEGLARAYLAAILTAARQPDEAVAQARRALETLEALPALRALALVTLAAALAGAGRRAEALEAARGALSDLEELGTLEEGEAEIRLRYAECLADSGDLPRARAAIAGARSNLMARAARIADPAWRERFLRDVPANARTLARADAWASVNAVPGG